MILQEDMNEKIWCYFKGWRNGRVFLTSHHECNFFYANGNDNTPHMYHQGDNINDTIFW